MLSGSKKQNMMATFAILAIQILFFFFCWSNPFSKSQSATLSYSFSFICYEKNYLELWNFDMSQFGMIDPCSKFFIDY